MKRVLIVLGILFMLGILAFLCLLGFVVWQENHIPPTQGYDAIIVLGAQVKADGEPSIQLSYRLEKALAIYLENPRVIVTTGAQGADEPLPEGEFMRNWLIGNGVAPKDVLADSDSLNTRQNLRNAIALLNGKDVNKVLIVTSDYHLPRAMALARDEGVDATGIASPSKKDPINWSRNHFREALAWVKYWVEKYTGIRLT